MTMDESGEAASAVDTFSQGYNCAQSVLSAFAEKIGLDRMTAFRISNGFGDGMGRMQEVCGAVTGAIMVIGMVYGRGEGEKREKQEKTCALVRDFMEAFRRTHGTVRCGELLSGCDLGTEEGRRRFHKLHLRDACAPLSGLPANCWKNAGSEEGCYRRNSRFSSTFRRS